MLNGTITKKHSFVILIFPLLFLSIFVGASCSNKQITPQDATGKRSASPRDFDAPEVVGTIGNPWITESSGIASSKCNKDVLWTHNDSGDKNFIFALDRSGKVLGRFRVQGAENKDWEDISAVKDGAGKCFLYIGDIGDNGEKRVEMSIYRVEEPTVGSGGIGDSDTAPAERIRFIYPEGYKNAETLIVHPVSGDIYVITKTMFGPAEVFKVPTAFNSSKVTAEKIAEFSLPAIPEGMLTGGDISSDSRHIVVCDYFNGYEFEVPSDEAGFDSVWSTDPTRFDIGERQQGEGVCYSADGTDIFATSEKANSPLIKVHIRQ